VQGCKSPLHHLLTTVDLIVIAKALKLRTKTSLLALDRLAWLLLSTTPPVLVSFSKAEVMAG
jgi:hypothetical protein